MGKAALTAKRATKREMRTTPLSDTERRYLRPHAVYEGSPLHKRNPGDFGLTPPAAPRLDKTLCDEAGVFRRADANALLSRAIDRGLVSSTTAANSFPKQLWVVDDKGRVFEGIYGGSRSGCYHGYPIRRSDPLFQEITNAWVEQPK